MKKVFVVIGSASLVTRGRDPKCEIKAQAQHSDQLLQNLIDDGSADVGRRTHDPIECTILFDVESTDLSQGALCIIPASSNPRQLRSFK